MNFEYIPLTFIQDKSEIKKLIRNTLILLHLFEKYNSPVRLESLIEGTQYGYNASSLPSGRNKFLRISDIQENKVNWESVPYCNCDDEETYLLSEDDILIARTGGTTGKSFKIESPPLNAIYAGYLIRLRAKKTTNPEYIYLYLNSYVYWSQIVNLNERNFRPKANAENLKSLIIPDCSKKIQDDIVRISQGEVLKGYEDLNTKIEQVLTYYDKAQKVNQLIQDQLNHVEKLNKAILSEAIRGKLTEQVSIDGNAADLLRIISSEKEKLIKQKELRIQKAIQPIKAEEVPYRIPVNWKWCKLGEIAYIASGSTPNKDAFANQGIPYLKMYNLKNQKIDFDYKKQFINKEIHNGQLKRSRTQVGDVIMNIVGPPLGKIAIIPESLPEANFNQAGVLIRPFSFKQLNKWIYYYLSEMSEIDSISTKGVAGQDNISITQTNNVRIPIPPLEEQNRIIKEVERLKKLCEEMKNIFMRNKSESGKLLQCILSDAFKLKTAV